MKLSSFIISLMVFGIVVMGMLTTFNQIFGYYNFGQYSNPHVQNLLTETNKTASEVESRVKSLQTSSGLQLVLEMFSFIFFGIVDILKQMVGTVYTLFSALNTILTETFAIPSWLTTWLIAIAVVSISLLIVKALLKWEI